MLKKIHSHNCTIKKKFLKTNLNVRLHYCTIFAVDFNGLIHQAELSKLLCGRQVKTNHRNRSHRKYMSDSTKTTYDLQKKAYIPKMILYFRTWLTCRRIIVTQLLALVILPWGFNTVKSKLFITVVLVCCFGFLFCVSGLWFQV